MFIFLGRSHTSNKVCTTFNIIFIKKCYIFTIYFYRSGSIVSSSIHQYRKESVTILENAEDEENEQQTSGSGLPDPVLLLPPQSPASNLPEVKTWVDNSAVEVDQVGSGGTNKPIPRRLSATTNLGKFRAI